MDKDHAYFFGRLTERNANPDRAEEIDAALWKELGQTVAVMVTDMSGFTRVTRERGIIHFLGLHVRSVALARPLFQAHRGRMVKREADNTISVFPDVTDALAAAAAVHDALARNNASSTDVNDHIHFCVGISYGKVMMLTDDLYGDAVNVAYKLGEDIATRGETLVSDAAQKQVPELLNSRQTIEIGDVELGFFRVASTP